MPFINNRSQLINVKVYVAEDDAFLREMLKITYLDFCPGVEVVAANGNDQIALSKCMELKLNWRVRAN